MSRRWRNVAVVDVCPAAVFEVATRLSHWACYNADGYLGSDDMVVLNLASSLRPKSWDLAAHLDLADGQFTRIYVQMYADDARKIPAIRNVFFEIGVPL